MRLRARASVRAQFRLRVGVCLAVSAVVAGALIPLDGVAAVDEPPPAGRDVTNEADPPGDTPPAADHRAHDHEHDHDLAMLSVGERRALRRWQRIERRLDGLSERAERAERRWRAARRAAREADAALAEVRERIDEAEARLRALATEIGRLENDMHEIGARLYMHSGMSSVSITIAVDSADASDLSRREVYAGSATALLSDTVSLLERREAEAERLRRDLVDRRTDAAELARERADQLADAVGHRLDAVEARRAAVAQAQHAQRELRRIRARRVEFETSVVASTQTSNSITLLLADAQVGQPRAERFRAIRPVGGAVSSPFGYRVHPILHTRRWHMGVDMDADTGETVHAAAGGRVLFAGVRSGYGNTVIVDHGNQYGTLYAHLSAFTVTTGDVVGRDDVVGEVGSTGMSTGPHLHFEVRLLGLPHNPVDYMAPSR